MHQVCMRLISVLAMTPSRPSSLNQGPFGGVGHLRSPAQHKPHTTPMRSSLDALHWIRRNAHSHHWGPHLPGHVQGLGSEIPFSPSS